MTTRYVCVSCVTLWGGRSGEAVTWGVVLQQESGAKGGGGGGESAGDEGRDSKKARTGGA